MWIGRVGIAGWQLDLAKLDTLHKYQILSQLRG